MNSVETHQLPDYYSVLKADPLAKIEQIEDLFRQLATEAQTSGDTSNIPQIIEAFEVLRDPAKRQQYDHLYFAHAQAQQSHQEQEQRLGQQIESAAMPAPDLITEASPLTDQAHVDQSPVAEQQPEETPSSDAHAQEAETQETVVGDASEEPFVDGFGAGDVVAELSLNPETLWQQRRELLKIFYERRRKDIRKSGIAIGGLDSMVRYSYELLEFHLWIMSEKKVIVREESGALSISSFGCEEHEQNIIDGLISSSL